MSGKKLSEKSFAYLNRSARPINSAVRELIESWLSGIPAQEQAEFCSRFHSDEDSEFNSAVQELVLHDLLRRQQCELQFHPTVPGTTKRPDFNVRQPDGSEFLLEARTSSEILTGPKRSPRANRIWDFLNGLDLPGYRLLINELEEGTRDLKQNLLAQHIRGEINAHAASCSGTISITPFTTTNGWRIRLTASPAEGLGTPGETVWGEAFGRTWTGPSFTLRDILKEKGGRYGNQFDKPYVIAINSFDGLTDRNLEETLFGAKPEVGITDGRPSRGLWGTEASPEYRRVSAVLFTINLHPLTLLKGNDDDCRLYLNPWAHRTYEGVLIGLPTCRWSKNALQYSVGQPLHELLGIRPREHPLE